MTPRRTVMACKDCRRGFFTSVQACTSHSQCKMCPGGYYMDVEGAGAIDAADGVQAGSTYCKSCLAGQFQPHGPDSGSGEYLSLTTAEYKVWSQDLMRRCADHVGEVIVEFAAGEKTEAACQDECAKHIACKGIEYGSQGCVVRQALCGTWPDSSVTTKQFYPRHQIRSCQSCPDGTYMESIRATGKTEEQRGATTRMQPADEPSSVVCL
jgi:hypothetical protein